MLLRATWVSPDVNRGGEGASVPDPKATKETSYLQSSHRQVSVAPGSFC